MRRETVFTMADRDSILVDFQVIVDLLMSLADRVYSMIVNENSSCYCSFDISCTPPNCPVFARDGQIFFVYEISSSWYMDDRRNLGKLQVNTARYVREGSLSYWLPVYIVTIFVLMCVSPFICLFDWSWSSMTERSVLIRNRKPPDHVYQFTEDDIEYRIENLYCQP